jgi:hypothetical protein
MLREVDLCVTDILGKPFGLIFEDKAVQQEGRLTLDEGNYSLYRNVGKQVSVVSALCARGTRGRTAIITT